MWDNRKLTVLGLRSSVWPSSISLISCHVISLSLIPERSKSIWKVIWGRKVCCDKETKRKPLRLEGDNECLKQSNEYEIIFVLGCSARYYHCGFFFPGKWGAGSHFRFLYHSGKHKLLQDQKERFGYTASSVWVAWKWQLGARIWVHVGIWGYAV